MSNAYTLPSPTGHEFGALAALPIRPGTRAYIRSAPRRRSRRDLYRSPVDVLVVVQDPDGVPLTRWLVAKNVDARYNGPRAAYGQAMAAARDRLAAALEWWPGLEQGPHLTA